jgi:hypothetical protein
VPDTASVASKRKVAAASFEPGTVVLGATAARFVDKSHSTAASTVTGPGGNMPVDKWCGIGGAVCGDMSACCGAMEGRQTGGIMTRAAGH